MPKPSYAKINKEIEGICKTQPTEDWVFGYFLGKKSFLLPYNIDFFGKTHQTIKVLEHNDVPPYIGFVLAVEKDRIYKSKLRKIYRKFTKQLGKPHESGVFWIWPPSNFSASNTPSLILTSDGDYIIAALKCGYKI